MIKSGNKVYYMGEVCKVIHVYDSGYCEIKKDTKIVLVAVTEVKKVE